MPVIAPMATIKAAMISRHQAARPMSETAKLLLLARSR